MPAIATPQNPRQTQTRLDRALALFSDVRAGEGATAVLMLVNVFLLLICYAVIKTVREPLILLGGGAEVRSYAAAGQALLLIGFVPLYSWVSSRVTRTTLIFSVTLFFIGCIELFSAAVAARVPYVGVAFFIWVGIFNMSLVAQFWSFANDVYTPAQGKRLFAIVGIGSSTGAVAGSYLAKLLVKPLGAFPMMLVAAAILCACLGLTWLVNAREAKRPKDGKPADDKPVGGQSGFAMLLQDRYLFLIGAVILLLNWVNTTGEYILDKTILAAAADRIPDYAAMTVEAQKRATEVFVGEFRGDFFFWVNLIGAIFQLFFVSRVLKYLGIRAALYSLPVIGLVGSSIFAVAPVLALVRIAKIAENACDYSLYNTTKQALWLPTTREAMYNAKAAIDTFLVRAGDMLSSVPVLIGAWLGFRILHFAVINIALIGLWLFVVSRLGTENRHRVEALESVARAEPA